MSTERTLSYDILSHLYFLYYMSLLSSHLRLTPTFSFSPQGFHINNVCICILDQACFMFHLPHSLSQQRCGFDDKVVRVGSVAHEVAVGLVFLGVFRFTPVNCHSTNASFAQSFDATYTMLSRKRVSMPRPARLCYAARGHIRKLHYTVKSGNNSGGKITLKVTFF
jgi:hypothetical protein